MVSRQIIRPGDQNKIPRHTHDGADLSGSVTFVRIVSGDIRSLNFGGMSSVPGSGLQPGDAGAQGWFLDASTGGIEVWGDLFAQSIILLPLDLTDEGGELTLEGAGANTNWAMDVFQNTLRFIEVDGATVILQLADDGSVFVQSGSLGLVSGSAAAPSLRAGVGDDGLFFADGVVGVTVAGTEVGRATAGQLSLVNGDATTPALGATADTDTGVFFDTAVVGVTAAGAEVARFTGTAGQNLQGLAWTTWTPTLTNLTLGNGTQVARYVRIGDTVDFYYSLILGSTSSVGTSPTISLPVTAASHYTNSVSPLGHVVYLEAGVLTREGTIRINSTTTLQFRVYTDDTTFEQGGQLTATSPHTWGTGDQISVQGRYEAA